MQIQHVDDYTLIKSIGKGNFGEVFLTQKQGYPQYYATKKMERRKCEVPPLLNRLINEIRILTSVKHPNIVKYIDLKKTKNHWYLITEFISGGSLTDILHKYMAMYQRPFPEDIVQHIMRQIVSAVQYLHFNRIIHRDLKLDNILVNFASDYDKQTLNLKNCQVKIIDFGFATILNSDKTNTVLGTPPNMDPKILEQITTGIPTNGYTEKVDIWSLGTLCYEMIMGYSPFRATNMQELYQKVKKGNYILPSNLSEEIVSFINSMLQQDDEERADADELMNHKFLVNDVSTFHAVDVRSIEASYIPGGMLNMKSKQPKVVNNINNDFNLWGIFTQPDLYYGSAQPQAPIQFNQQPQVYPQMQKQNFQSQPYEVRTYQNFQHKPQVQIQQQPQYYQTNQKQNYQQQYYPQQQQKQNIFHYQHQHQYSDPYY